MPLEPSAAHHSCRRSAVDHVGPFVRQPFPRSVVVGAIGAILVLGAGCSGDATTVEDSTVTSATTATTVTTVTSEGGGDVEGVPPGRQPEGFSTMMAQITEADGEVCEVCVWLADTSEERARGLMEVTDLGDAVGMVFRFEEPTDGSFYMFQTPTPLSIAWFAPDGTHVGSADMAPCLDTPAGECPLYSPGAEYDLALEVFEGGLADLGVGDGSQLALIDGTEADGCPLAADP